MIPFARETVTLYNRLRIVGEDGRAQEAWRRRVLHGCSWVRAHERVRDDGVVRYAASTVCRIPASPDYLSPGEWDARGAPEGTFTLAAGDILVYRAVEDEITDGFSAAALLKNGGSFCLCFTAERLAALFAALAGARLEAKRMRFVHGAPGREAKIVLLEAKRGARPGLRVLPPLLLRDGQGCETDEVRDIYLR